MELPQLGDHCTLENCKLLNFLPFRCDLCALTFCLDHRLPKAHACENYVEKDDVDPSMPKEKIKYKCELAEGCKNKELSAVICPKCDKNFCLAHRHPPDHNCHVWKEEERLRLEKHKPAKRTPVALNQRPLRSQKARQTAAKVALMKMKLHADGDKSIPLTERVYCWVAFPRNSFDGVSDPLPSQVKDKPIFFCDKWSLGRSIDFLSSRFNIQNQNNVGTARYENFSWTQVKRIMLFLQKQKAFYLHLHLKKTSIVPTRGWISVDASVNDFWRCSQRKFDFQWICHCAGICRPR